MVFSKALLNGLGFLLSESLCKSVFLLLNKGSAFWGGFPDSSAAKQVKNPPAMQKIPVGFLGQEDNMKKG